MLFTLNSDYQPTGDQPQAIEKLVASLKAGNRYQTLLGVTGSGKTFTMANVIAQCDRPTLIMSHNKTLAAQLYSEFKGYVHRERFFAQRRARADADVDYELARVAARCGGGGERVVHLRFGLAAGVHGNADSAAARERAAAA